MDELVRQLALGRTLRSPAEIQDGLEDLPVPIDIEPATLVYDVADVAREVGAEVTAEVERVRRGVEAAAAFYI